MIIPEITVKSVSSIAWLGESIGGGTWLKTLDNYVCFQKTYQLNVPFEVCYISMHSVSWNPPFGSKL